MFPGSVQVAVGHLGSFPWHGARLFGGPPLFVHVYSSRQTGKSCYQPIERCRLSKPRKKAFSAMAPGLCIISPKVRLAQLYKSFTRLRTCGNVPSMGIEVLIGTFEIIEFMVNYSESLV
uniref:Uncharacterized protein n=1 Tax=Micrurus lemniscatus lemniscatus TaxID=129467 RepID=A0A2D4JHG2_MICLE